MDISRGKLKIGERIKRWMNLFFFFCTCQQSESPLLQWLLDSYDRTIATPPQRAYEYVHGNQRLRDRAPCWFRRLRKFPIAACILLGGSTLKIFHQHGRMPAIKGTQNESGVEGYLHKGSYAISLHKHTYSHIFRLKDDFFSHPWLISTKS